MNIYLADMTYAALNRLLFIRITEDKDLLKRKISNGGIGVWRQFVNFLQDKYQDLVQLAYRDASHLYEHFFEYGIFDWYVKGDSQLNEVLIRDEPGAATKQIPVKYWKTGERYRV